MTLKLFIYFLHAITSPPSYCIGLSHAPQPKAGLKHRMELGLMTHLGCLLLWGITWNSPNTPSSNASPLCCRSHFCHLTSSKRAVQLSCKSSSLLSRCTYETKKLKHGRLPRQVSTQRNRCRPLKPVSSVVMSRENAGQGESRGASAAAQAA